MLNRKCPSALHYGHKARRRIEGNQIWELRRVEECWAVTGKAPIAMRWVGTNKAHMKGKFEVRSRMVARNFKGGDKDRDDLFAETPALEAKRLLMSRALTSRKDGRSTTLMFIDVKRAHLNPKCEEDIYLELPEECHLPPGYCGKLKYWMYGMRQAAAAREKHYADKL
eukprot:3378904-Karenia_brevis.AAC.1